MARKTRRKTPKKPPAEPPKKELHAVDQWLADTPLDERTWQDWATALMKTRQMSGGTLSGLFDVQSEYLSVSGDMVQQAYESGENQTSVMAATGLPARSIRDHHMRWKLAHAKQLDELDADALHTVYTSATRPRGKEELDAGVPAAIILLKAVVDRRPTKDEAKGVGDQVAEKLVGEAKKKAKKKLGM